MAKTQTPEEFAATLGEVPQYQVTEKCYIRGDKMLEAGESMYFTGKPAHYMEPLNDAAQKMVEKYPSTYQDPIQSISLKQEPARELT